MSLRRVTATRVVTVLREGGSLPALVEADDSGMYVVKFRGAGQGPGALVSEVLCGEMARAIGLDVPEVVLVELPVELAAAEPDPEVQDLLKASAGLNAGLDFLPGALPFAPPVDPELAALVVWFDALVLNVDRTPRNPNLLSWHGRLWCIDHGAALFNQHAPSLGDPARPLPGFDEHVLLPHAGELRRPADVPVEQAAGAVPEDWLRHPRDDYVAWLRARLDAETGWWPRA